MGCIAALTRNRLPDRLIVFISTLFTAVPSFVLATLLLLGFSITLAWGPVWSAGERHYLRPVIALAMYPMAYITRLTKTSMLDALGQDYVRTARAKGVRRMLVIFKHTLRNALIPVITYVGPMGAYILTGSLWWKTYYYRRAGQQIYYLHIERGLYHDYGHDKFFCPFEGACQSHSDLIYKAVDPRITFD